MAKARQAGTQIKPIGVPMRHLNKVSFAADSSTVIGEAVANPAYRESATNRYLGMLIHRIRVYGKLTDMAADQQAAGNYDFVSQLQTGDQSGTPAVMDLDNEFLFAHGSIAFRLSSGVGFQFMSPGVWPLDLEPVKATPIIVTPEFTMVHDAVVNHAAFQNKEMNTVIEYQIVEVPDRIFTQMLMNQSRTS